MNTKPTYEIEQELIDTGYLRVAGVDEAGRGALFSCVVAAACVIPDTAISILESKVNDSKKLSPKKREELFELIRQCCDVGVGVVSSTVIDEINILNATKMAMEEALLNLKAFDYAIIDGTVVIPKFPKPQRQVIKGDAKSLSIAAASVVAKVVRDRIMLDLHDIWPFYGIDRHKGYGTKAHIEALKTYGPCPEHRLTFNKVVW
jgi:ribonuclease HII